MFVNYVLDRVQTQAATQTCPVGAFQVNFLCEFEADLSIFMRRYGGSFADFAYNIRAFNVATKANVHFL